MSKQRHQEAVKHISLEFVIEVRVHEINLDVVGIDI